MRLVVNALPYVAVLLIIALSYLFYPPSYGIDPWRDLTYAALTNRLGHVVSYYEAYPYPVISIWYLVLSCIAGVPLVWSSVIVGITLLCLLSFSSRLFALRIFENDILTKLLTLLTPYLVLWTVWPIPQFATLTLFILTLYTILRHPTMLLFPLIVAIVITHTGAALWALILFSLLTLSIKIVKRDRLSLTPVLLIYAMFYAIYAAFTAVIQPISSALDLIFRSLALESPPQVDIVYMVEHPVHYLVWFFLVIPPVLSFYVWIHNRQLDRWGLVVEIGYPYAMFSILLGYLGEAFMPVMDWMRYFGLCGLIIMTIISQGIMKVLKNSVGKVYLCISIALIVVSLLLGGWLPLIHFYNATSVVAVPSYADSVSLKDLSNIIDYGNVLVDSRAGLPLTWLYLERGWNYSPEYRGAIVFSNTTEISFLFIGSSHFKISNQSLNIPGIPNTDIRYYLNNGYIFIYRPGILTTLDLVLHTDEQTITIILKEYSKVYNSDRLTVFC